MSNFLVGWAEKSIVPKDKRVSLAGQLYERVSKYVESDITATAMAVEAADKVIFVSVDIVKITEAVKTALDLSSTQVCVTGQS